MAGPLAPSWSPNPEPDPNPDPDPYPNPNPDRSLNPTPHPNPNPNPNQEALESPSYPTLRSVYTLHQLDAVVRGLPAVAFATQEGGHADSSQDSMVHVWAWRRDADDGHGTGPREDVDKLETQLRRAIDAHNLVAALDVDGRNQVVQWHPSQPGVRHVGGPRQAEAWRDSALPNAKYGKQARQPARMLPRGSVGRSRGFARSQRIY